MKKLLLLVIPFGILSAGYSQTSSEVNKTDTSQHNVVDSSDLYGYVSERPVKVGGNPSNQKRYLESLRDAQGRKIKYERKGSCCLYASRNAPFGSALLDRYEITYLDAGNSTQKKIVYISFYDFEEPEAIKGFTIVK